MILWFNEIGKNDIAAVGGKGANLGEMARSGFPVPPGFCVTTGAYREHIRKLELAPLVEKLFRSVQNENIPELDELSGKVRQMIGKAQMPEQAEQAIRKAYGELSDLGTPLVSVRSSATAEDLPQASFAGQQETFLSVSGEEQVLEHVQKCWASLWIPRSIAYRQKNGFAHEQVALSVVVQAMVQSEKSGVLFTVNPLTGSADEMMVNASYGLGESIVSGRVTPDTFRVSKRGEPLEIEKRLGSKETQIITGPEGLTVETDVAEELRNRFCLEETELRELLDLGLRVENHYGKPQDIEWAITGNNLYLLQARPVTVASAAPVKVESAKFKKMSRARQKILDNFKEHIPDAPYPLDYEPLLSLNEQKNAVIHELGISMPSENKIIRMDEHGVLSVGRLLPHPNIRLLWMPVSLWRMLRLNPTGAAKDTEVRLRSELSGLESVDISQLDSQTLADYIFRAVDTAMQWIYLRFRVFVFPMIFLGFFLNRTIRTAKLGQSVNQYDFLAGLDHKTAEIERALYSLAEELDETPAVRRLFLEKPPEKLLTILREDHESSLCYSKLTKFLKDYGARTMKAYTPFSTESWSERPELLFDTLAAILKAGNIRQHIEQQENGGRKHADLKDKISGRLTPAKRRRFESLLEQFRSAHMGREELIYRMEQCYVTARRGVREAANRLCKEELLSVAEDVRYLTLSELKQALFGESDCMVLKNSLTDRKAHRFMAEQTWNAGPAEGSEIAAEGAVIQGISGSPGIARGAVRIIDNPNGFGRLQKGEVLVCRFTDPVWTPLFSVACAVVCDTGGPLSHAAIVAREYGMPAVLGTRNATTSLKDGDVVTVDGSKGTVLLHRP